VLREVDEEEFLSSLADVRKKTGDRAVLRAMHFFAENRRAKEQAEALKCGNFEEYLRLVNESGQSSWCLLQNITAGDPAHQAVALTLARGRQLLGGRGAIRVHGGGFAGTVQAYVPHEMLEQFRSGMEALLGEGVCHVVRIRPQGGYVIVC
jgi:galactokinase